MGQQRRSTVAEVASTVITSEINRARHHRIDPEYPSIATPFTCAGTPKSTVASAIDRPGPAVRSLLNHRQMA